MQLSLALLASQVFFRVKHFQQAVVSNVFSKPSLFHIVYVYFLVSGYFQKIMSQQKCKASHPSIKQYFCSKPKVLNKNFLLLASQKVQTPVAVTATFFQFCCVGRIAFNY